MIIGKMTLRLTVQEEIATPDGAGGNLRSWRDIARDPVVSAAITPAVGREVFRFRKIDAAATHRLFLHYREDILPGMRMLADDAVYGVISAQDRDGQRRCLELIVRKESLPPSGP